MFRAKSRLDHSVGVTILAKGTTFTGTLYCRGISRVGGKVKGEIVSEGTLIIEQDAEIIADITAENLIIQGVVKGKVVATTKTELLKSSRLDGALHTPAMLMELGTIVNADVVMADDGGAEAVVEFQESDAKDQQKFKVDTVESVTKKSAPMKLVVDGTPQADERDPVVYPASSPSSTRRLDNQRYKQS